MYTHKQYSVYIQYKMGGGWLMGFWASKSLSWPIFLMMAFCFAFCESCFSMVQKEGGGTWVKGGGGGDEWRLENKEGRQQDTP